MIPKKYIFLIILSGVISTLLLGYFYIEQRNFTSKYRKFLFQLQEIDHLQQEIKTGILNQTVHFLLSHLY